MGRKLMRVPLDFDWPIGEAWEGYAPLIKTMHELFDEDYPWFAERPTMSSCAACTDAGFECTESKPHCLAWHPDNRKRWYHHPPTGKGYQCWQTTSEGSPISPVFETLEGLCDWLSENKTTFADFKASPDEWAELLTGKRIGTQILAGDDFTVIAI